VLYPWGFRSGQLAPDLPRYQALAGTDLVPAVLDSVPGSPIDHYHPGPGWNLYPTNGEYTDWAYRTYGTIAFTTELTSGCCVAGLYYGFEFPDDSTLVERVFRDNLPFARALIAASACRACPARRPSGGRARDGERLAFLQGIPEGADPDPYGPRTLSGGSVATLLLDRPGRPALASARSGARLSLRARQTCDASRHGRR